MNNKNKIVPTEEQMHSWFYLHRNVAAFTGYMIADDPLDPSSEDRELNEACFNKAYTTLKNALTIIATSKVKNILNDEDAEVRIDEIKNLINRYENELEKKSESKTFRPDLSRIGMTDNYLDYKWLEHYTYEDYLKIKEPKKLNLENWLNSKIAPFLSNWVLQLIIDNLSNELDKRTKARKNAAKKELRTDLKALFIKADKLEQWEEIIEKLKEFDSEKNRYIDENGTWAKKVVGHKETLAALIYYISITYVQADLNKDEISAMAKNNFNESLSPATAQTGKSKFDGQGFDEYFSD